MVPKHKIRIQLLDSEYRLESDRLISQYEELLGGPTEPHTGPFKLEVTIDSPDTIEKLKGYLDRLVGNLPIQIGSTRKKIKVARTEKGSAPEEKSNPYREIIDSIKKKAHIEDVIAELEEMNFRWINHDTLKEYLSGLKCIPTSDKIKEGYQWLVRVKSQGKDPRDDRYDISLLVGIRFLGAQEDKIYIIRGSKRKLLRKPWKEEKNLNMKKKKIHVKFPDYMSIDDRKQWRNVRRKIMTNPEKVKNSDRVFYDRYLPEIQNLDDNYIG